MIGHRDIDFLRLDSREDRPCSPFNKKINELSRMHPLIAFTWKFVLAPIWLLFVLSRPRIVIKNVNREIFKVSRIGNFSPFCLRSKSQFIHYSLSRVITLDIKRIRRQGKEFKVLRNELNKAEKNGYTIDWFEGSDGVDFLEDMNSRYRERDWRGEYLKDPDPGNIHLIVGAAKNQKNEIVGVSAIWISGPYTSHFYYFGLEKHSIRWILTEKLIERAFNSGATVFHTDNLMDVTSGSYIFQKALGYQTVRLRFR